MSYIDVSAAADPQAAAERWMKADLAKPIDLTDGPLFAFALFKAAPDRFFWYSRYHHIVMDGFGFALVARRVADVYTALAAGRTADAGPFGSLALLLEDDAGYRASKRFEQDRQYWTDYLAGLPEPASLGERPRLKSPGFIRHTGSLPSVDHRCSCSSIAQRTGVSLPQLVTAAAAIFVHRLTGAQDVVLDVPLTARMTPLARRTPGMMSNVLPVRLAVRPSTTVSELVGETARRMRQCDSPPTLQCRKSTAGYRTRCRPESVRSDGQRHAVRLRLSLRWPSGHRPQPHERPGRGSVHRLV